MAAVRPSQTSAQHPYASYPYAPRPQVDPRYVGPWWGAPAPHGSRPRLPPRAPRKPADHAGLIVVLVCVAILPFGLVAVGLMAAGAAVVAQRNAVLPTASAAVPSATVEPPSSKPELSRTLKGGACTEAWREPDEDTYYAFRDSGSAPRLRGKVAVLHVQLGGGESAWPASVTTRIDEAALLSQGFYLDQAKRFGVTDLTVDVIPWPLHAAAIDIPNLRTNSHLRLDDQTEQTLHDEAQTAIETAFGSSLLRVVGSYKKKGYDAVAFLVYLPAATNARDFAFRASRMDERGEPEIAIMFARLDALDHLAVAAAHEGMHLFGADDLYRLTVADKADAHDLMGDYCTGFQQTTVGDTTAYAVGWRAMEPTRAYGIVDW